MTPASGGGYGRGMRGCAPNSTAVRQMLARGPPDAVRVVVNVGLVVEGAGLSQTESFPTPRLPMFLEQDRPEANILAQRLLGKGLFP